MHDRCVGVRRNRTLEPFGNLINGGKFSLFRLLPLGAPAIHLAFKESCGLTELAKTHRFEIDGMKASKNIDEFVACRKGLSFIEVRNLIGVGINDAIDEVHQIERNADE